MRDKQGGGRGLCVPFGVMVIEGIPYSQAIGAKDSVSPRWGTEGMRERAFPKSDESPVSTDLNTFEERVRVLREDFNIRWL